MSTLLIKNTNIILPEGVLENHSVLCSGGKIVRIGKTDDFGDETVSTIIDGTGKYLAPGFIDLHIHGTHNYRIDNGPDDLDNISRVLPQYGVTGFLAGVCPLPEGKDAELLKSFSKIKSDAAEILGFHLEGPFLALTGALPGEAIGKADKARVKSLIEAAKSYKVIFSIAPDFDGIAELIPIMAQNNTPVFMTHTKASVKQTQAAIDSGARHATHFYDVFPCSAEADSGVRPCGAVEAILADERVSVDFILDGEHVDPIAVKMALICKGRDKVCLITDANIGAGLPPGRYRGFGNCEVEFAYPGGPARLTENSKHPGCLAGSGLTMDLAIRNAIKMLDVDISQAIRMASSNPARVLRIDDRKGQIKMGFDADIVLLDENINVVQAFVSGRCCYKK